MGISMCNGMLFRLFRQSGYKVNLILVFYALLIPANSVEYLYGGAEAGAFYGPGPKERGDEVLYTSHVK